MNGKKIAPCLELVGGAGRLRIATACKQHENFNFAPRGFQDLSQNQRDSANRRAASANQDGDPCKRGSFTGNPLERGAVAPWIVDTHWEHRPRELPAESRNQPVFDFALREFKLACNQSETRTARGVIERWEGRREL